MIVRKKHLVLTLTLLCSLVPLVGLIPGHSVAAASSHAAQPLVTQPCTWQGGGQLAGGDRNAIYWYFFVHADPAVVLTFKGTYPAARYASIQVYTSTNTTFVGLPDKDFPPDPGSLNPFAGSGGTRGTGTYTTYLAFQGAPSTGARPGTIYASVPASTTLMVIYRLYLPDTTATITGNVPLPNVTAYNLVTKSFIDCPAPVQSLASPLPIPAITAGYFAHWRAGLLPNVDTAYLSTLLPVTNSIYIIRFKAPTSPKTLAGQPISGTYQVRYWSLCLYATPTVQATALTCINDEQAPLDPNGYATFVIGPTANQPSNATLAHGIVWIPIPAGVNPVSPIVRQLLPDPSFTQSGFNVPYGMPLYPYMDIYTPLVASCSTQQFETNYCTTK